MKVLVTGSAGFIGYHLCQRLLAEGDDVFGVDNFNDYYFVQLKRDRHRQLEGQARFDWLEADITDLPAMQSVFREVRPDCVIHLAAQAGVRYSLQNPFVYQKTNVEGFLNVLECCRHSSPQPRLIYASSSSVYGGNTSVPFSENQNVDTPVSLYAATKKANELMAHCYSHLYGMQTIGLRFFTVYGPWGRPDMAYWLFTEAIIKGDPIKVFNHGNMYRDFTYIDDIINGVVGCVKAKELARYEIFNIGNHRSEKLTDMIAIIAGTLGNAQPKMEFLPMQEGDVPSTCADIRKIGAAIGYKPKTSIADGLPKFVDWYKRYFDIPTYSH